jgi:hypothetical protein
MPSRSPSRIALAVVALAFVAGCGGGGSASSGGKAHALGETAVVDYAQATSTGANGPRTMLGVTVLRVRKGTPADLTKAGYTADDKTATPYYVDARYTNKGQTAIKRNINLSLEDSGGNSLPTTLLFVTGSAPYAPCPDKSKGMLKPGESFETCSLVLVPKGRNVKTVLFVSQKANNEIVFTRWAA